MQAGEYIEGQLFGLRSYNSSKVTSKGDPMVDAVLVSSEGEFSAKAWKEAYPFCLNVKEGEVVRVWGQAKPDYRDSAKIEISLQKLEKSEEKVYEEFLPKQNIAVLDIETVGIDFDSFDEKWQEYIQTNLNKNLEENEKQATAFYPITAKIVCIALHQSITGKGIVFNVDANTTGEYEKDGDTYVICKDEQDLLEKFWAKILNFQLIVTFNGNSFDIPFIYFRSGVNRVKVTKDIAGTRYDKSKHIDLQDEISCYKAMRVFKLDFVSQAFGITSPKETGLDGSKVTEYFKLGRNEEIADYCLRDVKATYELYQIWNRYMRI